MRKKGIILVKTFFFYLPCKLFCSPTAMFLWAKVGSEIASAFNGYWLTRDSLDLKTEKVLSP